MASIWDRKIILHGNTKIKRDFEYLFEKLDIEKNKTYKDVNLTASEYLIVSCEKEKGTFFEKDMKRLGMEYGEGYVYIKDFFLYYNPIFLERKKRRLAVWGTGTAAEELWTVLSERGGG